MTDLASRQFTVPDKNPEQTRRRILHVLADLGPYQSMPRRQLSVAVWGTDKAHASQTYSALGWLFNKGWVKKASGRDYPYAITSEGRKHLELQTAAFGDGGAA